jgi:ABC-type multidrug transport system ATPase subunit
VNVLNLSHVSFAYPDCVVLRDFSAQLAPGVSLVLGGDGRGKTTVLCLLAGELPPDAGRLLLDGVFLDEQPEAYRQQVFWIDPRSKTHDVLTVADYLQSVQRAYPGFDEAVLTEAAQQSTRTWVVADYVPPSVGPLTTLINLGD